MCYKKILFYMYLRVVKQNTENSEKVAFSKVSRSAPFSSMISFTIYKYQLKLGMAIKLEEIKPAKLQQSPETDREYNWKPEEHKSKMVSSQNIG